MLEACRSYFVFLAWFALSSIAIAAPAPQPTGHWVLENTDKEMPYGGLKLNKPKYFELLMYDSDCQLYKVEGSIRQKSERTWELKNSVDHSNTFIMTRQAQHLHLVDTEGAEMLFTETTPKKLKKGISQNCQNHQSQNNKVQK